MFQIETHFLPWVWNTQPPFWYPKRMGCDLLKSVDLEKKGRSHERSHGAIGIPVGIFIENLKIWRYDKKLENLFFLVHLLQIIRLFIDIYPRDDIISSSQQFSIKLMESEYTEPSRKPTYSTLGTRKSMKFIFQGALRKGYVSFLEGIPYPYAPCTEYLPTFVWNIR